MPTKGQFTAADIDQPQGGGKFTSTDVDTPPEQSDSNTFLGGARNVISRIGSNFKGMAQPFMQAPSKTLEGIAANQGAQMRGERPSDTISNFQETYAKDKPLAFENLGGDAATAGLMAAVPGAIKGFPRTGRAVAKFEKLKTQLADTPVSLTHSQPHLENLAKIGATGPEPPATVGKLMNRSQAIFPPNYPEARFFQENLSNPSILEKQSIGGSMKGGIKQLKGGLYQDILDAANTKGLGKDYTSAMNEFRRAAQIKGALKGAAKVGIPAAVGGGIAGHYLKNLVP